MMFSGDTTERGKNAPKNAGKKKTNLEIHLIYSCVYY